MKAKKKHIKNLVELRQPAANSRISRRYDRRKTGVFTPMETGVFARLKSAVFPEQSMRHSLKTEAIVQEYDKTPKPEVPETGQRDRFYEAIERIQNSSYYNPATSVHAPYGYFNSRPLIGEKTAITGGVYLSARPHEAIVVDPRYGSLNTVFEELMAVSSERQKEGKGFKEGILSDVFELVQATLRYNPEAVDALSRRKNIKADQKVALDLFIEEGVGVARHHVLLAGYLLERLRTCGFIAGTIFLDAQTTHPAGEDERLIYTNTGGSIYVLDPRGSYFGSGTYCREMIIELNRSKNSKTDRSDYLH